MHEGNPVLNTQIRGQGCIDGSSRLYISVECAWFLQSLFQQNKTTVSFREIARLIARNSLLPCLMLRGLLFNSIQKFRENNSQ